MFPYFVIRLMITSLLVWYFLCIQLFLSSVMRSVFISVLGMNPFASSLLMSVLHFLSNFSSCVQLLACLSNCEVQTPYACLFGILQDKSGYATIPNENASLLSYVSVKILLCCMLICRSRNVTLLSSSFSLFSYRFLWYIRVL